MIITFAALGMSKHRTYIMMVIGQVDTVKKTVHIKFAKRWHRKEFKNIPSDVDELYHTIKWHDTFMDQSIGEHLIEGLKHHKIPLHIFTTQKNLKDPKAIHRQKTVDKIEMVGYTYELKQAHRIKFPANPKNPHMNELISQIGIFAEKITEAGSADYYAPGDEHDDGPKALMSLCFGIRRLLRMDGNTSHVLGGIGDNARVFPKQEEPDYIPYDEILSNILHPRVEP